MEESIIIRFSLHYLLSAHNLCTDRIAIFIAPNPGYSGDTQYSAIEDRATATLDSLPCTQTRHPAGNRKRNTSDQLAASPFTEFTLPSLNIECSRARQATAQELGGYRIRSIWRKDAPSTLILKLNTRHSVNDPSNGHGWLRKPQWIQSLDLAEQDPIPLVIDHLPSGLTQKHPPPKVVRTLEKGGFLEEDIVMEMS